MSFGLGPVVLNLAVEQNRKGYDPVVWSFDSEADRSWAAVTSGLPSDRIHTFKKSWPNALGYSREMEKQVSIFGPQEISIVHQHGIWAGYSRCTNMFKKRGVATVITPHGSLQEWAIKKSKWKKKLALALYESNNFRNAGCFHAVSEQEVGYIRDFGIKSPVAVIPNGVPDQWLKSVGDGERFRCKFGISSERRILLFLSRITPKKGLPMLLRALHAQNAWRTDWVLVIAGADEFGHQAEVEAIVRNLGLEANVQFVGPVFDQIKRDAFAAAELFVLPSYSEGAPIVILEALAAGVPVVATKASPWNDLEKYGCGWLTDINPAGISAVLEEAFKTAPPDLAGMGKRGFDLVRQKYTWEQSGLKSLQLYDWLLGRAERPEFVV